MPNRPSPGFVPFEPVDHTADLAYIARGRTYEELFENAARGLMAFLIDPATVRPLETEVIEVEGQDREECLINWLQEILFREEVRQRLYRDFEVLSAGPRAVRAICRGEKLDPGRHALFTDIKAATYHDLRFETEPSPVGILHRVRIVLDI